jgi:hypothetical protein
MHNHASLAALMRQVDELYATGLDAADIDAELELAIEELTAYGEEADAVCACHVSAVSEMDSAPISSPGEQLMVSWCFWNNPSKTCVRDGYKNFAEFARADLPFLPGVTDAQIVEAAVEAQVYYAERRRRMKSKKLSIK